MFAVYLLHLRGARGNMPQNIYFTFAATVAADGGNAITYAHANTHSHTHIHTRASVKFVVVVVVVGLQSF